MTGLFIFIHVIACALLILVILMQQGRGGGLTENFASVESIFGAKTNETLVRGTAILATVFLVTCLTLAFLSSKRSRSLMDSAHLPASQSVASQAATVPAQQQAQQPVTAQTSPAVPEAKNVPVVPAAK